MSRADVYRLLAERYDTKSNVKLGGSQSQLEASYVSSNTEEFRYNGTVCLWMTIYICVSRQYSKPLKLNQQSPSNFFVAMNWKLCFDPWKSQWKKCVECQGVYFEENYHFVIVYFCLETCWTNVVFWRYLDVSFICLFLSW